MPTGEVCVFEDLEKDRPLLKIGWNADEYVAYLEIKYWCWTHSKWESRDG